MGNTTMTKVLYLHYEANDTDHDGKHSPGRALSPHNTYRASPSKRDKWENHDDESALSHYEANDTDYDGNTQSRESTIATQHAPGFNQQARPM